MSALPAVLPCCVHAALVRAGVTILRAGVHAARALAPTVADALDESTEDVAAAVRQCQAGNGAAAQCVGVRRAVALQMQVQRPSVVLRRAAATRPGSRAACLGCRGCALAAPGGHLPRSQAGTADIAALGATCACCRPALLCGPGRTWKWSRHTTPSEPGGTAAASASSVA